MAYRNCVVCGTDTGKIGNVKYCSNECKKEWNKKEGTMYNSREAKKRANDRYTAKNRDKLRAIKASYRLRLKYSVLAYYSSEEIPQCERCGEKDVDCLVLDHVNNNGKEHRDELNINYRGSSSNAGTRSYEALSAQGLPDCGLQVLCASCNTKKEIIRLRTKTSEVNPFWDQYITDDDRLAWLKKW